MPPNGVVPSEAEIASIVPPIKVAAIPLKPGVRPRRRRSNGGTSANTASAGMTVAIAPDMEGNLRADRLLVMDHEPDLGRLIKNVAEGQGFEVLLTEDSATVLKTARTWQPTMLMLDLRPVGTDGVELLRGLAEEKCTAHVVLMGGVNGKVMESAMQLGRERGLKMSGFLHKPVQLETARELLALFKPQATRLSDDLAEAIEAGQLFLEYQLKFDCHLKRMTGVEALVRWRHPDLGVIQPDQFITLAEKTDIIHRLTDWVVVTAAKQMAAWQVDNPNLSVAVNISAKNLENLDLPDRLHQHCQDAGIDCTSMTLELTETGAMREAVQLMDVMTRLRLKGFKLSIDDFGVGYSSLVQLQQMPFSEVKIDRSFVMQMMTNEGCNTIVAIVIDLARKLGLRCVAEGVEDEATLRRLMVSGCDAAQGYHLSRPLAADRIPAFIADYQLIRGVTKAPKAHFPSPFTNARAWRRRKTATRPHTPLSALA
jgi:EAL domain-containing protein (putative c-di-GMP-specific phosphodiesterase class I)/ActR/RegA family two-component response regulator